MKKLLKILISFCLAIALVIITSFAPPSILNKSHPLAQGLVTYWLANEGGGSFCFDSYGTNNYGTLTNMAMSSTSGWSSQLRGNCLTFDGTNDYVRGQRVINISRATVSAWVYISANPSSFKGFVAGFLNGILSDVNDKCLFIGTDGKPTFYIYDGLQKSTSAAANALTLNQWNHLVGTADGTTAYCYVNGVQVGSVAAGATYTGYTVANTFITGSVNGGSAGVYLNGKVNNVMFYNHALTSTEVRQLYTTQLPYANNQMFIIKRSGI